MKKETLVLLTLIFLVVINVNAQLKVDSSGTVNIQCAQNDGKTVLSIGDLFSEYNFEECKKGLYVCTHQPVSSASSIAICGLSRKASGSNYGASVGLWGEGSGGSGGRNIGVVGTTLANCYGIGVYGTTEGSLDPFIPSQPFYAGYFYGPVYVDNEITTQGVYYTSDIRLKTNVESLRETEVVKGSTLDNLLALDVIEYNLKKPELNKEDSKEPSNMSETGKRLQNERASRRHYGLSAQELQKVYPDLVMEGQNGYLTVNYTELVPILIRSIQELKQELDEARTSSDNDLMRSRTATDIPSATTSSSFQLFQNNPNPFTECTTIRFTLPDDAQNVYIYIFDMQGKLQKQMPVDASMSSVTINGYELQPGMYIYSLVVGGKEMDTKRMILSK